MNLLLLLRLPPRILSLPTIVRMNISGPTGVCMYHSHRSRGCGGSHSEHPTPQPHAYIVYLELPVTAHWNNAATKNQLSVLTPFINFQKLKIFIALSDLYRCTCMAKCAMVCNVKVVTYQHPISAEEGHDLSQMYQRQMTYCKK